MNAGDSIRDHYAAPRNAGAFPKGMPHVGTGVVERPDRGLVIRMQVRLNPETGVIEQARFKAFGCGYAIAACSFITEWVRDKTVTQALSGAESALLRILNLPEERHYLVPFLREALQRAIGDAADTV
jgi:nitrogen fixation NifU-like protein